MILQDDQALVYSCPNQVAASCRASSSSGSIVCACPWCGAWSPPRRARRDEAEVRCHQPRRLSRRRLVSLRRDRPGGAPDRDQGLLPAHGAGPQLGDLARSPTTRASASPTTSTARSTDSSCRPSASDTAATTRPPISTARSRPCRAIDYWGVYNEPNIGGWTTPQWRKVHGRFAEASPAIYRRMADAAWSGLVEHRSPSRHDPRRRDRGLRGQPQGLRGEHGPARVHPRAVLREGRLHAAARHCRDPDRLPRAQARRGAFVAAHPALFSAHRLGPSSV